VGALHRLKARAQRAREKTERKEKGNFQTSLLITPREKLMIRPLGIAGGERVKTYVSLRHADMCLKEMMSPTGVKGVGEKTFLSGFRQPYVKRVREIEKNRGHGGRDWHNPRERGGRAASANQLGPVTQPRS